MIRKRVNEFRTIINLDGPDGNANNLIGIATMLGRDMCMKEDELKPVIKELMAGDYIHLLKTFENHFGVHVVLETDNESYLEALS